MRTDLSFAEANAAFERRAPTDAREARQQTTNRRLRSCSYDLRDRFAESALAVRIGMNAVNRHFPSCARTSMVPDIWGGGGGVGKGWPV